MENSRRPGPSPAALALKAALKESGCSNPQLNLKQRKVNNVSSPAPPTHLSTSSKQLGKSNETPTSQPPLKFTAEDLKSQINKLSAAKKPPILEQLKPNHGGASLLSFRSGAGVTLLPAAAKPKQTMGSLASAIAAKASQRANNKKAELLSVEHQQKISNEDKLPEFASRVENSLKKDLKSPDASTYRRLGSRRETHWNESNATSQLAQTADGNISPKKDSTRFGRKPESDETKQIKAMYDTQYNIVSDPKEVKVLWRKLSCDFMD